MVNNEMMIKDIRDSMILISRTYPNEKNHVRRILGILDSWSENLSIKNIASIRNQIEQFTKRYPSSEVSYWITKSLILGDCHDR